MNKCIQRVQNTRMYPHVCLHSWWGRVMAGGGGRGADSSSQPEKQTGPRGRRESPEPGDDQEHPVHRSAWVNSRRGPRQRIASSPNNSIGAASRWSTPRGAEVDQEMAVFLIPRKSEQQCWEERHQRHMIHPCYAYTVSFDSPVFRNHLVSNKYKLQKCTLNCLNWLKKKKEKKKKHIVFNWSLATLQVTSSVLVALFIVLLLGRNCSGFLFFFKPITVVLAEKSQGCNI